MLVYSSHFQLAPEAGYQQIVDCVARWIGKRSGSYLGGAQLTEGLRQRLRDGSVVVSRSSTGTAREPGYPFLFCAQLSHGDNEVAGRRWVTEIGLRQADPADPVECTVVLKTDEVSARVTAPIQASRPRIVQTLMDTCTPSGDTPGLRVKRLDESSARAFLAEVERESRHYPIVVVSASRDGSYTVSPERLRSLLVGIAEVVEVPAEVDSFRIEEVLGSRYGAWAGAINVLFLARRSERGIFCDRALYRPTDLAELIAKGKDIDAEILGTVTHRTNLPYSWNHISLDVVSQSLLRSQFAASIQKARGRDESHEYVALLEEADKELLAKDREIAGLRLDIEERTLQAHRLQADVDGLKHALNGRSEADDASDADIEAMRPLREAVASLVTGEPSLEQSLTVISTFFPDRIVVLDSAYVSARDSAEFMYGKRAFDLLWTLANGYWSALAGGQGDANARRAFGTNQYAQNEGDALSNSGKKRRTFHYRGTEFLMEKHLKIGIKDSVSETLRIHFEWIGAEKRLVIGHCGKHLDF